MLHEYHVIYSVNYYPWFHITVVGLGTYYPQIQEHYYIYVNSEVLVFIDLELLLWAG
jgi:hypothetical protein